MIYLILFWEFFKTGLFAVGGGLATLPFLTRLGENTGWFTHSQLADMVAVSESTPGPIGVNMATYVGFTAAGVPGAVVATVGLITPSIIIILIIAGCLKNFRDNRFVNSVFTCLRPASAGLIAASGLTVASMALLHLPGGSAGAGILDILNWKAVVLAAILFVLTTKVKRTKGLHPIVWIVASAVVGVVFQFS
ncbi:chromate transporter [Bacilliculturomica massiliensis]|uniref:chromate transporter n=1 Tax=Bacilliculturomica massiliensis TaxID=1917867 RepID=UPI001030D8CA|nr:chromate transporter [Bacilliculturomica massiliensis]